MKQLLLSISSLLVVVAIVCCEKPQQVEEQKHYPISPIDIKSVVLTDSFWLPKIKMIQRTTIKHAFEKCYEEGRMDNFLIAGKKKEGKTRGVMPFDDTDLYKTIEGASYSLISLPDAGLENYLDSVISIIKTGQEPDGYLTTWFTIDRAHPPADWVKPSKERWENEITSHELYNSGHLFEAAAAHYWATGKRNLLDIAIKNADLLVANFRPDKLHRPPGHQIAETGLIKLYDITHQEAYLKLAKYFIDLRGDSTSHPLYGAYYQDHLPVVRQSEAVGHAVRAEYLYAGMTDIAAIYKDTAYSRALDRLWDNTVDKKMYLTGGVGARHDGEAFGDNYELPNLSAYAETCASIGSVWWNQKMFLLHGDAKYYDVLERTLYNGLLAGMSADGTKFFYTNPLESDGKFMFNRSASTRQSWFDCSCCPTNMIRFLPSLAGLIYATREDTVYVNLFASSEAHLQNKDGKMTIHQQTGYPWDGNVSLGIEPEKASLFTMRIRIPGWFRNEVAPGDLYHYRDAQTMVNEMTVNVNGKQEHMKLADGYVTITREWKKGDVITWEMPMNVRTVIANNAIAEDQHKEAVELGPFVYCAEERDNKDVAKATLNPAVNWQVQCKELLGERVNVIEGVQNHLTMIPYYLWSNRGVGKMKVWLPVAP